MARSDGVYPLKVSIDSCKQVYDNRGDNYNVILFHKN